MKKKIFSLSLLLAVAMLLLSACSGAVPIASNTMPKKGAVETVQESPVVNGAGDLLAAYQGTLENIYSTVSTLARQYSCSTEGDCQQHRRFAVAGLSVFQLAAG